ncbi:S-formylglutathione hydrolase [Alloalcanivorax xenomutans]|uniref:S-formylglutathione hydrolase n=1 Tax=Alloalcanivorax xenomutans TaxID=1094342 RepID=UPI0024E1E00F|nr:S-formylglutathione hydrolase [Alloalcanivorax xenomutans]
MKLEKQSSNKSFDGWHHQVGHRSEVLDCDMRFAIYLPPGAAKDAPVPVLYWLSGLTCTDENFMQKAGAQRLAAELGVAMVAPDTSPRGDGVADDDSYDLGKGAGFYVNATEAPWRDHYRMYDYVVEELPALVEANFPVTDKRSIAGHSMGGHGALMIALRNPGRYVSVSAFSPICHPVSCPWGQKAFGAYLGSDESRWREYDASLLMQDAEALVPALVDQGNADDFLDTQLEPEALESAANARDYPLELRRHDGYDHSYYFIATFVGDHLNFHARHLKSG